MDFHVKWILHRAGHEEEFLTAPEISTLTDYGRSYEQIKKMQPLPVDKGAFLALALALALPMIPVVLAEVPLGDRAEGVAESCEVRRCSQHIPSRQSLSRCVQLSVAGIQDDSNKREELTLVYTLRQHSSAS